MSPEKQRSPTQVEEDDRPRICCRRERNRRFSIRKPEKKSSRMCKSNMRGAFILIQMSRAVQNVFLIFIIGKVAQFLLPPPISSLSLGFSFFFYTAMKFSLWSQKRTTLDSNGDLFESCSSNFFFISYVFPPPLSLLRPS